MSRAALLRRRGREPWRSTAHAGLLRAGHRPVWLGSAVYCTACGATGSLVETPGKLAAYVLGAIGIEACGKGG
jgi:hypothetical protein